MWLERHRGICPGTIRQHVRLIAEMLPRLGDDPGGYGAALIRRVLFEHMEPWSRSYAQRLTTAMRMYLRFLVSEGSIAAALVEAVPTVPQWRLSTLPRYIPADDVERTIASCGDDPMGVRDRAILLLLARLALRAGDIVALRLGDIDWDRAEIRVSGKSRRQTALPLPQDAGDALHAYIATVRPRVDEEKVFLCANAPCRPFTDSSTVSAVAERALDRAGVKTFAGRGAHAFRHSQATALLRSGATLDVIQSLLRHASPEHHHDLRQDRCGHVAGGRPTLDRGDRTMTTTITEACRALCRDEAEAWLPVHAERDGYCGALRGSPRIVTRHSFVPRPPSSGHRHQQRHHESERVKNLRRGACLCLLAARRGPTSRGAAP